MHSAIFFGIVGGDVGGVGEREAHGFDEGGHGVGGVHAAAGAGAGAGVFDDGFALGLGDFVGEELAIGFEGGDDIELAVFAAEFVQPARIVPP